MLNTLANQSARGIVTSPEKLVTLKRWAKANRATVTATKYAREAWDVTVSIPSPWDENAEVARDKRAECLALPVWCRA